MKRLYAAMVLSVATSGCLMAQALYNNGTITVQSSGSIYVNGKVQIDASGSLANDGTVEVKGDWENDRTDGAISYTSTPGVVVFSANSGTNQNIIGNSSNGYTVTFDKLETDNPIANIAGTNYGVGNSSTNSNPSNIVINQNLTFMGAGYSGTNTNGGLYMGDKELTLGVGATITNGSSGNYAYFTNNGTTSGSFSQLIDPSTTTSTPVLPYFMGTTINDYVPAALNFHNIPVGANKVSVSFYPSSNIGHIFFTGSCTQLASPAAGNQDIMLSQMVPNFGYWQIDATDGSGNNIDNTGSWDYDVKLFPSDAVVSGTGWDYYKLLKLPSHSGNTLLSPPTSSTDWSATPVNSGNFCTGLQEVANYTASVGLTATNLSSFSRFGGGGNDGGGGLPITLVSLTANAVNNQYISVNWITATEINNAGFEVQRSTDGTNFQKIGWVDGHGNSTSQLQYSLGDKNVTANVLYYYRLKQFDLNGDSHYSNIVSAAVTTTNAFTVSDFVPNPATNTTKVEILTSEAKRINVTVYNTLGQVIQKSDYDLAVGSTPIELNVNDLAAGTYFGVITAGDKVYDKKIVVTK